VAVRGGEWLEHDDIERLEHMSQVRWKHRNEYTVNEAVVGKIVCKVTAMAINNEETVVSPWCAFFFVQRLNTFSNHVKSTSLFVHPEVVKVINTSCSPISTSATHEACSVFFAA
jgi:hypothetical protein